MSHVTVAMCVHHHTDVFISVFLIYCYMINNVVIIIIIIILNNFLTLRNYVTRKESCSTPSNRLSRSIK